MIRFLIRVVIYVVTVVLGLLVTSWVLPDFQLSVAGFVTAVVVFSLAQGILTPFIISVARKYAPAVLGGIGLVSTLVALFIASMVTDGIQITGVTTWILGSLLVWIITALGGWLLPLIFLKKKLSSNEK